MFSETTPSSHPSTIHDILSQRLADRSSKLSRRSIFSRRCTDRGASALHRVFIKFGGVYKSEYGSNRPNPDDFLIKLSKVLYDSYYQDMKMDPKAPGLLDHEDPTSRRRASITSIQKGMESLFEKLATEGSLETVLANWKGYKREMEKWNLTKHDGIANYWPKDFMETVCREIESETEEAANKRKKALEDERHGRYIVTVLQSMQGRISQELLEDISSIELDDPYDIDDLPILDFNRQVAQVAEAFMVGTKRSNSNSSRRKRQRVDSTSKDTTDIDVEGSEAIQRHVKQLGDLTGSMLRGFASPKTMSKVKHNLPYVHLMLQNHPGLQWTQDSTVWDYLKAYRWLEGEVQRSDYFSSRTYPSTASPSTTTE